MNQVDDSNWAYTLFVKSPELYLPFLEAEMKRARNESLALDRLFRRYGLTRSSRILDLCCGIGRHSVYLAKMGYQVVGYDPSSFYLDRAKRWSTKEHNRSNIKFYHGDPSKAGTVLSRSNEVNFDAVILMSNSFGFSTEQYDHNMLKDVLKVAARKGILIIETENRDWRIRSFQPFIIHEFRDSAVHETWNIDLENSVAEGRSKYYKIIKESKNLQFIKELKVKLRLYSLHELRKIINAAGWRYLDSYAGLQSLKPPDIYSEHLITICQKK